MENAWTKPLIEDKAACSWLLSDSDAIQTIAVNAIPIREIDKLVAQHIERSDHKLAVKFYFGVVNYLVFDVMANSIRYAKTLVEMVHCLFLY